MNKAKSSSAGKINPLTHIIVKGARENNLKDVSFNFPKNQLVVFTGVSGSGKSSMAFDTLFAEGQRRYVESLSSYARQFLGNSTRPQVDMIEGLSPAIAINQKAISHNPRSTVGTVTEIYDYLRLLFARIGHPHCPQCGKEVIPQTAKEIVTTILEEAQSQVKGLKIYRFLVLAPLVQNKASDFAGLLKNLRSQGYKWIRVDGQVIDLYSDFAPTKTNKHNIEAVVDRVSLTTDSFKSQNQKGISDRLIDSIEQALTLSDGQVIVSHVIDSSFDFPEKPISMTDKLFSEKFSCPVCNISLPDLEPTLFSFNSPAGACSDCNGLGAKFQIDPTKVPEWKAKILQYRYFNSNSDAVRSEIKKLMHQQPCTTCHSSRLNPNALSVTIDDQNIYQITQLPIDQLNSWLFSLTKKLTSDQSRQVLEPIQKELASRLEFLLAVGLDYLSLDREAGSLSSGESQRIRLASQIGTGLTGVLYILDEPTIGLHPRDNSRLIATLKKLKDAGNTLVVVEHDEEVIRSAQHIVDFGPKAGHQGGQIVAQGSLSDIQSSSHLTGQYLSGKKTVGSTSTITAPSKKCLTLSGCSQWNLKDLTVKFPLNRLIAITGVSGSGKSTLIHDTLYPALIKHLRGSYQDFTGQYKSIDGAAYIGDCLLVDQSPIGRTPRSNPATYTKIFDDIRNIMANSIESQIRGFKPGRFSFNVKGGRCDHCDGQGVIKIEMQFLPDVYVTCEHCAGSRYKDETLEVTYKDKNIAQILKMTVDEAIDFFGNITKLKRKLLTVQEVGLGYLELGQASNTLSGGESQRLKISRELVKKKDLNTVYILDEPTTGLHFDDVARLIKVLQKLVRNGNTVIVIEHNLDVVKNSDWIIDLGPEGGDKGGHLVAQGTIEDIIAVKSSHTGQYLKNTDKPRNPIYEG